MSKTGIRRNVVESIPHEGYGNLLNDIALMKLNRPLEFNDAIRPIELLTEEIPDNGEVVISGWGKVSNWGQISNALKFNTLRAINQYDCANQVGINFEGLVCLGHNQGNGACNGDSGGSALYKGKLCGVANFVYSGCGTENPDGYAKVSHYVDWINQKIKQDD